MSLTVLGASVNLLAVFGAAVLYMVLSTIWYSPSVLGKRWAKLVGLKEKDMNQWDTKMMITMLVTFVGAVVVALFLGMIVEYVRIATGYAEVLNGIITGLIAWVIFAVFSLANTLYARESAERWAIDAANVLISLLAAGVIIAVL